MNQLFGLPLRPSYDKWTPFVTCRHEPGWSEQASSCPTVMFTFAHLWDMFSFPAVPATSGLIRLVPVLPVLASEAVAEAGSKRHAAADDPGN
ncbi:hypothetical protein RRG08_048959 [Elysia crispata]|uniref:Uncharacterized protein n=1 Tax=Elysia crispata TaxID=231223 RepID=A0AAE0YDX1_9GAST|nr:hypothetical protein RRG08_048959 [Elysia crispata]